MLIPSSGWERSLWMKFTLSSIHRAVAVPISVWTLLAQHKTLAFLLLKVSRLGSCNGLE